MRKRVLSLLLAFVLGFSMLPAAVLAEEYTAAQDSVSIDDVRIDEEDTESADGGVQDSESDTDVPEVQSLIDNLTDEVTAVQENTSAIPMANAEDMPQGEGTAEAPYLVGTLNELNWFRDTVNGGETGICAKLTADIALDTEWTPIGAGNMFYENLMKR